VHIEHRLDITWIFLACWNYYCTPSRALILFVHSLRWWERDSSLTLYQAILPLKVKKCIILEFEWRYLGTVGGIKRRGCGGGTKVQTTSDEDGPWTIHESKYRYRYYGTTIIIHDYKKTREHLRDRIRNSSKKSTIIWINWHQYLKSIPTPHAPCAARLDLFSHIKDKCSLMRTDAYVVIVEGSVEGPATSYYEWHWFSKTLLKNKQLGN